MDIKRIDEVADLMEHHGLSRIRVEDEDGSAVELERMSAPVAAPPAPPAAMPTAPVAAPAPTPVAPTPAEPALVSADGAPIDMAKVQVVSAPMVGVFYAAPSPGADPFVHVGSKVHAGDTLCVIEAMKLMNEVTAETDGEVVDVCAEDGELVEYGCCLMKLY